MPNPSNEHVQRRDAIRELLGRGPVSTQQTLVEELGRRGFSATQSSVSRDLRELGVAKLGEGYAQLGTEPATEGESIPAEFIREYAPAGDNLTVIKTAIGAASRVALSLDRSSWPEIVGTISGDDTIFVATRNAREQKQLLTRLRAL